MTEHYGRWAFLAGIAIAIITGIIPGLQDTYATQVAWLLLAFGLIIGLLNITEREQERFLVAGISLLLASTVINIPHIFGSLNSILTNLTALSAPAVIVVALKTLWELARD